VRWFRNQTALVWDEAGQPRYAHGLLLDVTERKSADAELERRLSQLDALHTIDQAISGSTDLRFTLSVFLEQVVGQLGVDAAAVLQLDRAHQTLHFVAGRGFRTTGFESIPLRVGEGRPGRAALERRIVVEPNLAALHPPSRRSRLLAGEGFVSYYGVPLVG